MYLLERESIHVLTDWVKRENPAQVVREAVEAWIDGLWTDPRQEPSRQRSWPHPHSSDELRHGRVPQTDVDVIYAIDHPNERFRLLGVGTNLEVPD